MNKYHVYPRSDLRNHIIDSPHCWCNPTEDDWTIIHNSMDRREDYEQGRKSINESGVIEFCKKEE